MSTLNISTLSNHYLSCGLRVAEQLNQLTIVSGVEELPVRKGEVRSRGSTMNSRGCISLCF